MKGELLSMQVGENIPVPMMIKGCSSGKVLLIGGLTLLVGKLVMNSTRANPFLVFGVANSRSNY